MEKMLSIAEARRALSRLPDYFTQTPDVGALAITRRGQPVLAVLSWAQYEALVETLDILGDEEQTAHLRRAVAEIEAGRLRRGRRAGNPNDLPHRAGAGQHRR